MKKLFATRSLILGALCSSSIFGSIGLASLAQADSGHATSPHASREMHQHVHPPFFNSYPPHGDHHIRPFFNSYPPHGDHTDIRRYFFNSYPVNGQH